MTNYEKYKSEVLNLLNNFSVIKGKGILGVCNLTNCRDCVFGNTGLSCSAARLRWLYEEYEEPPVDWSKVPIDTKVLVSDNGEHWCRRYFAGVNSNGEPTVYPNGLTSWSVEDAIGIGRAAYKHTKLAEEE